MELDLDLCFLELYVHNGETPLQRLWIVVFIRGEGGAVKIITLNDQELSSPVSHYGTF